MHILASTISLAGLQFEYNNLASRGKAMMERDREAQLIAANTWAVAENKNTTFIRIPLNYFLLPH